LVSHPTKKQDQRGKEPLRSQSIPSATAGDLLEYYSWQGLGCWKSEKHSCKSHFGFQTATDWIASYGTHWLLSLRQPRVVLGHRQETALDEPYGARLFGSKQLCARCVTSDKVPVALQAGSRAWTAPGPRCVPTGASLLRLPVQSKSAVSQHPFNCACHSSPADRACPCHPPQGETAQQE